MNSYFVLEMLKLRRVNLDVDQFREYFGFENLSMNAVKNKRAERDISNIN